ncbi:MAG: hypothetical protein ABIE07_01360 [Candidatus Zixiibacteriota bacterium]
MIDKMFVNLLHMLGSHFTRSRKSASTSSLDFPNSSGITPLYTIAVSFIWTIFLYSNTLAFPPESIRGTVNLNSVKSTTAGEIDKTFNQDYSISWSRQLLPYVKTHLSLQYNDLGIDHSLGENSWRQRLRPSAQMAWNHSDFIFRGLISRQKSISNNEATNLHRDNTNLRFSTNSPNYPILTIQFDRNHSYNDIDLSNRNDSETRIQTGASYQLNTFNLYYNLAFSHNRNNATGLIIDENNHLFRWNQSAQFFNKKLRLNSGYNLSHRMRSTQQDFAAPVYKEIHFASALYAYDQTPDQGELTDIEALSDGDITQPTEPPINIGEGNANQNIGVDLGFDYGIDAIYIYTDAPSGPLIYWDVYTSSDNLIWTKVSDVASSFNSSYGRYEVFSPTAHSRYIKAVNYGINDAVNVYVTEIQVLEESADMSKDTRKQTSHRTEISSTYMFSKNVESSIEFSWNYQPRGDFVNSRSQIYYAASTSHKISSNVKHGIRYQAGVSKFKTGGVRNGNSSFSYSLAYNPFSTLKLSLGAFSRLTSVDQATVQETNNLSFKSNGQLLPGLNLSGEAGYSRNNSYDSKIHIDSWTYRLMVNSNLSQALDVVTGLLYQTSHGQSDNDSRIRRQLTTSMDLRATQTILMRGSLILNTDNTHQNTFYEFNLSWNVTPRISIGGLITLNDDEINAQTLQRNIHLNYLLGKRTALNVNYTNSKFPQIDRSRVTSLQFGLRSGF